MKIKSISFENYKAFPEKQTIQLKPITVLIGKNSSGKSSIAKLFTLLENSLSGEIDEPLRVKNNGVELGAEFRDLVCGKNSTPLGFEIELENSRRLKISIVQDKLNYQLNILEWSLDNFKISYAPENDFTDDEGNSYQVNFKGFIPTNIMDKDGNNRADDFSFAEFKMDLDYIGPFRVLPQRQFYLTGQITFPDTGIKGENAYAMLGVSKRMGSALHEKVGEWYQNHFDGWRLIVEHSQDSSISPFFQVSLNKSEMRLQSEGFQYQNATSVNIVDVGQGMNQALPLIVRANEGRNESIIVLEQPELHLHPAAHGDLAELFAKSAKDNNQIFILETHSENILLRLRKLVVQNDFGFTREDLVFYWIEDAEDQGQRVLEITVDDEGVLSDWQDGVFNENIKEILEMQKAIKKKNA